MTGALPTVVDLNVLNAVLLEVIGYPFRIQLDLLFIDLLVEEVPGTPAGRRQRELRLIDWLEVFDLQSVAKVVLENCAVFETQLVFNRIESAIGEWRRDVAERHHHQIFVSAVANPRGDRIRPG